MSNEKYREQNWLYWRSFLNCILEPAWIDDYVIGNLCRSLLTHSHSSTPDMKTERNKRIELVFTYLLKRRFKYVWGVIDAYGFDEFATNNDPNHPNFFNQYLCITTSACYLVVSSVYGISIKYGKESNNADVLTLRGRTFSNWIRSWRKCKYTRTQMPANPLTYGKTYQSMI